MPNSQNRNTNNSNSGKGQPNDRPSTNEAQKPNPERSDIKHNTDEPKSIGATRAVPLTRDGKKRPVEALKISG